VEHHPAARKPGVAEVDIKKGRHHWHRPLGLINWLANG
jgi:hypothetical protein